MNEHCPLYPLNKSISMYMAVGCFFSKFTKIEYSVSKRLNPYQMLLYLIWDNTVCLCPTKLLVN